jgi:crotonobetainyl-CoA:carnitine CoA-transferase CaiB-like acyl-CoA transferase
MSTALLAGVTTLEFGTGVAVAHCGRLLADLGATVTKHVRENDPVDASGPFARSADGRPMSLLALDLNAGKQVLESRDDSDGTMLPASAATVDVVLLGEPYAADAAQIFADLSQASPGAIVVSFTPYGLDGPKAGHAGADLTALASGGFLHMVGDRSDTPLRLAGHQALRSQGTAGFTGAMTALFARELHGRGALVDAAAAETVAYMEWKADIYTQADGRPRRRDEPSQWFDLSCVDGPFCFIYENPDWPKIKALVADPDLERPQFQTRDGRLAHHAEVAAILQRWIGAMPKAEAYHLVQKAGIPAGMVADMQDLTTSAHYQASGFFGQVQAAGLQPHARPRPAWTIDGVRPEAAHD